MKRKKLLWMLLDIYEDGYPEYCWKDQQGNGQGGWHRMLLWAKSTKNGTILHVLWTPPPSPSAFIYSGVEISEGAQEFPIIMGGEPCRLRGYYRQKGLLTCLTSLKFFFQSSFQYLNWVQRNDVKNVALFYTQSSNFL